MTRSGSTAPVRRVLLTAEADGEIWEYALELARGFVRHDISTVLAVLGPSLTEDERARATDIPGLVLEEHPGKVEWMSAPWHDVDDAGRWLLRLEARWAPEVVHLHGTMHATLPFRAPKVVVGHSCVFSWWDAVNGGTPTADWSLYRRRAVEGLNAADKVVAPTRWMLGALRAFYGPLPQATVVPHGRTASDFPVGDKEAFILGAGRLWDYAQNLKALARVAGALSWSIRLIGDTASPSWLDADDIDDAAAPASPPSVAGVQRLGRLKPRDLARTYGAASIYALPARYEPFGLSVLEAALAGCVLVLGDIPSLRETWDGAALFVDPDDDDALAATLRSLTCNGATRAVMSARARRRALQFSARKMVDAYVAIYDELIAGRRQQGWTDLASPTDSA